MVVEPENISKAEYFWFCSCVSIYVSRKQWKCRESFDYLICSDSLFSTPVIELSFFRAEKRAAWRQARLKSLEQDALQAQAMIQSMNQIADDFIEETKKEVSYHGAGWWKVNAFVMYMYDCITLFWFITDAASNSAESYACPDNIADFVFVP